MVTDSVTEKAKKIIKKSEEFKTKKELAKALGISRPTLDSRLKGKSEWKGLESLWIENQFIKLKLTL